MAHVNRCIQELEACRAQLAEWKALINESRGRSADATESEVDETKSESEVSSGADATEMSMSDPVASATAGSTSQAQMPEEGSSDVTRALGEKGVCR